MWAVRLVLLSLGGGFDKVWRKEGKSLATKFQGGGVGGGGGKQYIHQNEKGKKLLKYFRLQTDEPKIGGFLEAGSE